MPPRGARELRVEDEPVRPRTHLRAVADAPARRPARSWGELDWTPSPGESTRLDALDAYGRGERFDPEAIDASLRDRRRETRRETGTVPVSRPVPARRDAGSGERRTIHIVGQPTPPRRPGPTMTQIESRPDRVALWAVVLGLFLVFMAAATAKGATWSHATLGERTLGKGDRGSDVLTLQRVLGLKGYGLSADGVFGPQTSRTVKRYQRRRHIGVDGKVGPMTTRALAATWKPKRATYYGPGLYGNRTACGQTLAHRTRGVAHRSLGCGRRVAIYHAGRIVLLPVIDRGPFTDGVALDLTEAGARKVGMTTTSTVRAGY